MLKLGESSLSIDRGYCQREDIGRLASATASIHWRSMEVASHYSASREYMLIIHFRGYVCRRTNKDFVYFIIQLSYMHLSHSGRLHAPCKREVHPTSVRIGPGARYQKTCLLVAILFLLKV